MIYTHIFKGIATALVTPFTADGSAIDYPAFGRLIEYQLSNGVDALVVCGTTGEASVLSEEEKKQAISFVVRQTRSRVPVIAGTGSNDIATACRLSEYACSVGADALLAVTPYYNKVTKRGLIDSYSAIAAVSGRPVIVYNVPSRTGVSVSPNQYLALSSVPGIAAVKEANGDMTSFAQSVAGCGDRLTFYSGNDELLLPSLALGGGGLISVASNVIPRILKKLYILFISGDIRGAAELQKTVTPLEAALFRETNPVPVKAALRMMGLCGDTLRLPLTKAEPETERLVESELRKLGLCADAEQPHKKSNSAE